MLTIDTIRLKIERAKKHIGDLDVQSRIFFDTDPYGIIPEKNPQTREVSYRITKAEPVPDDPIAIIIGDALQNLRSSLDYIAHRLVVIGRKAPEGITFPGVYFPICDEAKELETHIERKVKCAGQDAKDAIRTVKPYKGGDRNNTLWRLNKLNSFDKHRLLLTVASYPSAHSLLPSQRASLERLYALSHGPKAFPYPKGTIVLTHFKDKMMPLKTGDVILTIPESEVEQDMKFHFVIAFNEPGIAEGEPVIETLQQTADFIEKIVLPTFASLL